MIWDKSKHSNPSVRLRYASRLKWETARHRPAIRSLAVQDPDPRVRCKAILHCHDIDILKKIKQRDFDEGVRALAKECMYTLLSGTTPTTNQEIANSRISRIKESDDQELLNYVIHNSPFFDLQICALLRIKDPTTLKEISKSAANEKIRYAALRQLTKKEDEKPATTSTPPLPKTTPATGDSSGNIDLGVHLGVAKTKTTVPPAQSAGTLFELKPGSLSINSSSRDRLDDILDKIADKKRGAPQPESTVTANSITANPSALSIPQELKSVEQSIEANQLLEANQSLKLTKSILANATDEPNSQLYTEQIKEFESKLNEKVSCEADRLISRLEEHANSNDLIQTEASLQGILDEWRKLPLTVDPMKSDQFKKARNACERLIESKQAAHN